MKLRYRPEGASAHEWEFDPDRLTLGEASEVERRCSPMTYEETKVAAVKGSVSVKLAYVFVLLKRDTPNLKFETLRDTTRAGDITLDYDLTEMVEIRAALVKQQADGDTSVEIVQALEVIDQEIADQGGAPEPEVADPKDEASTPSATSGGLPSPQSSTSTLATSNA